MRMSIRSLLAAISVIGMTAFSSSVFAEVPAPEDAPDLTPAT